MPEEILFWHTNVTKVSFRGNDYINIRVDPLNFTDSPAKGQTGYNRWFFLQVITTFANF